MEAVYDLEVEGAHSFLTAVCAVHNYGSNRTIAHAIGDRGVLFELRFAWHYE